ncbi:MAG: PTS glucose transporter subunit IIA [Lacticaseibacillus songhuajiangensis]|jgi:PTS system glucose-specific IIA component|nr:PTS glucose transporter subunit IIA [Lacticaseibacillus songhuajiangensis]
MFGFFKKNSGFKVVAPVSGMAMPIEGVKDDVFSSKMMGDGFAVSPTSNDIFAPVKGRISTVFPTKHAIGITTPDGLEVLVHMGLDTVEMEGAPFEVFVEKDQEVNAGDQLAVMDRLQVQQSGRDDSIVVVYTNMDLLKDYPKVENKQVEHGDELGNLKF